MNRPSWRWLSFILALLPLTGGATALLRQDLPALVKSSDAIVQGHVRAISSHWSSDHRRIYTNVELEVVDALKGAPASRVIIQQPGGEVGNVGQRVDGLASFKVGEEVVVFLERHGAERYRVSGLAQGKLHVDRSGAVPLAVPERLHGALLLDPKTHNPTALSTESRDLESLRQEIRALVAQP